MELSFFYFGHLIIQLTKVKYIAADVLCFQRNVYYLLCHKKHCIEKRSLVKKLRDLA